MFKHFAQFSTSSKTWVTRATWVTETPKSRKPAASETDCPVAQNENTWVTVANRQEPAEYRDFSGPVAQVTQVTQNNIRVGIAGWGAEEWRIFFHERAAITEENEFSRAKAEARAYECCIVAWLNRNPPSENGPECCVQCNKPMEETEALPFLTGDGGHIWMHDHCHAPWMRRRQAEAAGALRRMGVAPPSI